MIALLGAAGGALYIRLRWHRAPQAYRAMIALAAGYGIVGILIGAWVLHFELPENESTEPVPKAMLPAPSTVSENAVANPTGADGLAIAKYLVQTRGVHSVDICDLIGMYADTITVARESGQAPDAIRALLHAEIEKRATSRFLAATDMSPAEDVIDREIEYAYGNRDMGATQVRSYWVNSCVAQRRG
jgi:hypothetical protein